MQQGDDFIDGCLHGYRPVRFLDAAAEIEKMLDQLLGAVASLENPAEKLVAIGGWLVQHANGFDIGLECEQDIVEIVGDAAGEGAKRFQFFHFHEAAFHGLLFGDIVDDQGVADHLVFFVADGGEVEVEDGVADRDATLPGGAGDGPAASRRG